MKTNKRQLGILAENLAATALFKKGYQILKRNFSTKIGEIDLIAKDKDTLVFIEVKAKTGDSFGIPETMINPKKLKKLKQLAEIYLEGKNHPARIDVVAVTFDKEQKVTRLKHYQNIY